ncbi:MAG: hypothetical protein V2J16_10200 [Thermoleophilia bacterium]|jgi:tetratricopeptide (TPR) repeat protein|nr:hypothetical protein [Thermoleophilia bacterium]
MSRGFGRDLAGAIVAGVAAYALAQAIDKKLGIGGQEADEAAPREPGQTAFNVCGIAGIFALSSLLTLLIMPDLFSPALFTICVLVSVVAGLVARGICRAQSQAERWAADAPQREVQAKVDEVTRLLEQCEGAEPAECARLLAQAQRILPDNLELRLSLLGARLEAGRAKILEPRLRRRLADDTGDRVTQLELAVTLGYQGRHDEALPIFRRLAPKVPPASQFGWAVCAFYGAALLAAGDAAGALEVVQPVFRRKRSLEDTYVKKCLLMRALAQAELGRKAAARRDLERLAAADPEMWGLAKVRAELDPARAQAA